MIDKDAVRKLGGMAPPKVRMSYKSASETRPAAPSHKNGSDDSGTHFVRSKSGGFHKSVTLRSTDEERGPMLEGSRSRLPNEDGDEFSFPATPGGSMKSPRLQHGEQIG